MSMLSNYPPGVTGNEPQIAGYPPCVICGHDAEAHDPDTGECEDCDCAEYDQFGEADDVREPDEPNYDPPSWAQ